jgi:hypothetical protein
VRFAELLRATVLTSTAGATALIVATLAGVNSQGDTGVVWIALGWWLAAGVFGQWLGAQPATTESIRSLLGAARSQASLPELHPGRTFLNRLWPLMLCTLVAAAVGFLIPQVPAVAAGFMIIWAFSWRRQPSAVTAIEDRDGARFYVDRTPAWRPIRLVRTPGFRATLVEMNGAGRPSASG